MCDIVIAARNGDTDGGGGVGDTNMAELWASYHSALGLAGTGTGGGVGTGGARRRDQPVSWKVGS